MLTLLLMVVAQPAAVKLCDPTTSSKCASETTTGGKTGLDVNCIGGCSGSSGSGGGVIDGGTVGVSQVTSPWVVSAASLPLPTGASTSALQTTGNTSLANLDVLLSSRTKPADQQHVIVDTVTPTVNVAGTFFQATQPVSATSLPLPTGAATETTLGTRLSESVFVARSPVPGQAAMAASSPVVVASDQILLVALPDGGSIEAVLVEQAQMQRRLLEATLAATQDEVRLLRALREPGPSAPELGWSP